MNALKLSSNGLFPVRSISLTNVFYRYPESNRWILEDISLTVPIGSRVAFVGPTGSGKSTAAHLLLGLLSPQKGSLGLDGVPVDDVEIHSWHSSCSQVPQSIHLLNTSVYENVAFGVDEQSIDFGGMGCFKSGTDRWSSCGFALWNSYSNWRKWSQIIRWSKAAYCIACAFYRRSKFLVLDEATSALDNQTELRLFNLLKLFGRRCTTLVIAHRLSTIQRCDRIYESQQW